MRGGPAATDVDRYDFLASAVAGLPVTVRRISSVDALAYSDGHRIYLSANSMIEVELWAAVAAQSALIGAGSLQAATMRPLIGRTAITKRYLYLEMLRAARSLADRLPWAFTVRADFQNSTSFTNSAQESLELAVSQQLIPEPPDYFGRIMPLLIVRGAFSAQGLAGLSHQHKKHQIKSARRPKADDDDDEAPSQVLRLLRHPFAAGNPLSKMFNQLFGGRSEQQRSGTTSDTHGGELAVGRVERALKRGIITMQSMFSEPEPTLGDVLEATSIAYPEWNIYANAYRRDWVFVEETEAWRESGPSELQDMLIPGSLELRRQLSGLGLDYEIHRRQIDGSDLDLSSLIERVIEVRTGHLPPAMNIYRASRHTRRNLGVAIVIDISGSTGERPLKGDSTFEKQMKLAFQLGQTLDILGDRVAIFGFHSWSRHLVRVVRIKEQQERWSIHVAERMAMLEPAGYTRIGTAIRHGKHILNDTMRLPNRLLILITDGIAYDIDYETAYASADARKAIAETREAGTACVILSVGSETDNRAMLELFGPANILVVDKVDQTASRIREVCRHALASVCRRPIFEN